MATLPTAGYGRRTTLVLGLLAILLATQIRPWWMPVRDSCGLLSIARSIAQGGPIANLGSPQLHYTPGYPLLVSPAFLVSDRPFLILSIVQWLFAVVLMLGVHAWARAWLPGKELWITALVMANASLWLYARFALTEMAFMAALIWTVQALDRLAGCRQRGAAVAWTLIAAVSIAGLSMIRPVGILLVCGYGVVSLMAARRGEVGWMRALASTVAVGLPAALCIVAVMHRDTQIGKTLATSAPTYFDEMRLSGRSLIGQLSEGACLRVSEVGRLMTPNMYKAHPPRGGWLDWKMAWYVPVFAALAYAWWRLASSGGSSLLWALPFYLGVHVLYAYDQATRYLLPMLPVLVLCLWYLVDRCCQDRRVMNRILGTLVAAHLAVAVFSNVRSIVISRPADGWWPQIDALAAIIHRDPMPTMVSNLGDGAWEMCMLATDSPMLNQDLASGVPDQIGWIITHSAAPQVPGYVERHRAGNFRLLERVAQARGHTDTESK